MLIGQQDGGVDGQESTYSFLQKHQNRTNGWTTMNNQKNHRNLPKKTLNSQRQRRSHNRTAEGAQAW